MRFPFLLGSVAIALCNNSLAQTNETQTAAPNPLLRPGLAPRPTEPKAQIEFDLRALLNALNGLQGDELRNQGASYSYQFGFLLSGAREGFFGSQEWVNFFAQTRGTRTYRLEKIEVETLETDAARVKVFYSLLSTEIPPQIVDAPPVVAQTSAESKSETLNLRRENSVA